MRFKTAAIFAAVVAGFATRYLLLSVSKKKLITKEYTAVDPLTKLVVLDSAPAKTAEINVVSTSSNAHDEQKVKVGLLSAFHKIPKSALALSIIYLSLFAIPQLIVQSGLPPTDIIRRFGVGMFLTTYASLGYFLFQNWILSIRAKTPLQYIDTNKWLRPFSAITYLVIIIAGVAVFYVSWEGDGRLVGLPFGIGAFISGVIFNYGPKRLIEHDFNRDQLS
jgi:hypothetical protein